uniref:integrin alpha-8-like isoform X2 n=1 Tax=Panthera onca TaxID=9690 RepID=UPI0029557658|nr:integrin alpha-8-like isoform X2 [Panthera onca]
MSARARRGPRDGRAQWLAPLWCLSAALGVLRTPASQAFNLDVDKLTVYSGPEGSYFGYAVDFHIPAARTASVLVGAPKANTSQPDIVEGGAVYYCPWPAEGSAQCKQIPFDNTNEQFQGERML